MNKDLYELKVITYNIHSGKDYNNNIKIDDMIKFLKNENAHILGIQELNENSRRGLQVSKIKEEMKMNCQFGENVKIGDGYYGIGTFSCFSIIEKKHILLPSEKEQRGLLDTIIKLKDKKINILNTHLGLSLNERSKQFKFIQEYIDSINNPYILMGDFNTSNPKLDHKFCNDCGKIMKKENIPTLLFSDKRIDYIYISSNFQTIDYQVVEIPLSDHYPVVVKLKFSL